MLPYAYQYLTVRSLGAPAVLLSLAMQGVFRVFKDTKTPLYATGNFYHYLFIHLTHKNLIQIPNECSGGRFKQHSFGCYSDSYTS